MVVLDCGANMLLVGCLAFAFPVRVFGSPWACIPIFMFRSFVYVLNRSLKIQYNP